MTSTAHPGTAKALPGLWLAVIGAGQRAEIARHAISAETRSRVASAVE